MRDELWKQAIKKVKEGGSIIQVWTDQNPQGFSYRQYGVRERSFVDVEGLSLVQIKRETTAPEPAPNNGENLDPEIE